MSEIISGNIIDNNPVVKGNITEKEAISGNIIEAVQLPSTTMAYTIDFDENQTISAFYSKHIGNITAISSTNISSYTIGGSSISLPYSISLNTTYLFEITKTTPGQEAQLVITVEPSAYTEIINGIDWTTGDGRYTYLLGDLTTNTTLLKYDNDLFTRSNYLGSGAFTTNPLVSTITLPTLPVNGYWSKVLYIKDDYMLISGGNTGSFDKYFCKVNISTDAVTDLDDIAGYSTKIGAYNGYPKTQIYDYINNVVYFAYRGVSIADKISDVSNLNLNTNVLDNSIQFSDTNLWTTYNKVFVDPYQLNFQIAKTTYSLTGAAHYKYTYSYNIIQRAYNRENNRMYTAIDNDTRRIGRYTHKGVFEFWQGGTGIKTGVLFISLDHENDHIISHVRTISSTIAHKIGDASYGRLLQYPATGESTILDAMFMKNYTHVSIYNSGNRLHLFDMGVDISTINPEFGYIDPPVTVWHLYGNKIL